MLEFAVRSHIEHRDKRDEADTKELLFCLLRILRGQSIAFAFGSPGYWGYSTAIGKALAAPEDPEVTA
jgi:hypothetical protein